jgi:hypothetical protein
VQAADHRERERALLVEHFGDIVKETPADFDRRSRASRGLLE